MGITIKHGRRISLNTQVFHGSSIRPGVFPACSYQNWTSPTRSSSHSLDGFFASWEPHFSFSKIFAGTSHRLWCFCLSFFSSLISLPPKKICNRQNAVLRICEYSAKWLLRISQIYPHELPRRSCWYCVFGLQSGGLKNGLMNFVMKNSSAQK